MKTDGELLIRATPEKVAACLRDPKVLQGCIPGCTELVPEGQGTYRATFSRMIGSQKISLDGTISVHQDKGHWVIAGRGKSLLAGSVGGQATLQILPDPVGSRLSYQATTETSGLVARLVASIFPEFSERAAKAFFRRFQQAVHMG